MLLQGFTQQTEMRAAHMIATFIFQLNFTHVLLDVSAFGFRPSR